MPPRCCRDVITKTRIATPADTIVCRIGFRYHSVGRLPTPAADTGSTPVMSSAPRLAGDAIQSARSASHSVSVAADAQCRAGSFR